MQIINSLYQSTKLFSTKTSKAESQQNNISISVPLGNPNLTLITRSYCAPLLFTGQNLEKVVPSNKYEKGIKNLENLHEKVKLLVDGTASKYFPDGTEPDDDPVIDGYRTYYTYNKSNILEKIAKPDWVEQHLNMLEKLTTGYDYLTIDQKRTLGKYFDNVNFHIAMMQGRPELQISVLDIMGSKKMGNKLIINNVKSIVDPKPMTEEHLPEDRYYSLYPIFDFEDELIY